MLGPWSWLEKPHLFTRTKKRRLFPASAVMGHESELRAVGRSVGPSRGTATRIMDRWNGRAIRVRTHETGRKKINPADKPEVVDRGGMATRRSVERDYGEEGRGKNNRLGGSLFVPVERISPLRPTTTTKKTNEAA
jgi:hypothetical protein